MNKAGEENNNIIFRHFLSFLSLSLSFFSTVDRSIFILIHYYDYPSLLLPTRFPRLAFICCVSKTFIVYCY